MTELLARVPLPNRVSPWGDVERVAARGTFTGNRGIIHDPATRTLLRRRWTTKAWIVCALHFGGRRRQVMSPGTWTELFFLDEVTALAAGHRPCFYCRREAARDFARRFAAANGLDAPRAPLVDAVLHAERRASRRALEKVAPPRGCALPDGAMVAMRGEAYAVRGDRLLRWSHRGYGSPLSLRRLEIAEVELLTPPSTCRALAAGYAPVWHPDAWRPAPAVAPG